MLPFLFLSSLVQLKRPLTQFGGEDYSYKRKKLHDNQDFRGRGEYEDIAEDKGEKGSQAEADKVNLGKSCSLTPNHGWHPKTAARPRDQDTGSE